jgi:hypothetical protein
MATIIRMQGQDWSIRVTHQTVEEVRWRIAQWMRQAKVVRLEIDGTSRLVNLGLVAAVELTEVEAEVAATCVSVSQLTDLHTYGDGQPEGSLR